MKSILFKNFTNESFTHTWDKDPYTFGPGQEMYMEDWKAEHFAKHLIDRELNRVGALTNDQIKIAELKKKCLLDPEVIQSESTIIDKNIKSSRKSKKTDKDSEEEFPDLKK